MIQPEHRGHSGGVTEPPPRSDAGQPAAVVDVPERPARSRDVQLVGEMPGTGFADRQWLVQRNGHFIQLTELLYRIAEYANGDPTLEQIAARVTDATARQVTPPPFPALLRAQLT